MSNSEKDINNIAASKKTSGLFALSKAIKEQQEAKRELGREKTITENIESKLEELRANGTIGQDEMVPLVVGSTGLVIQGDSITKNSYLQSLAVSPDVYGGIVMTKEEAVSVSASMNKLTGGVNSVVPMTCTGDVCAFKKTCIVGSTLVQMADGTSKPIKNIRKGDRVLSFNEETKQIQEDISFYAQPMGKKMTYTITTEYKHKLTCTADHPILSSEGGRTEFSWASIEDGLSVDDVIIVTDAFYNKKLEEFITQASSYGDGFKAKIISIEEHGVEEVYDTSILLNHNFFANGICIHNCPYHQIKKAPVGLPCIVEANLIHFYAKQYMEEFDVDPTRLTEIHLVGELAEFNIYEMRATKLIAEKYPTMLQDYFQGFSEDGSAIINEDIAKVFELKEKIKKSRLKILETLMATRKERAKAVISAINSQESASLASLKSRLESIAVDIGTASKKGKWVSKEVEDIIENE